jgi:lysophospholipase L1-like esterase
MVGMVFSAAVAAAPADGDWAQMGRFKAANQGLTQSAQWVSESRARVVFMGDSITEGWIQADPAFFSGAPYVNRGISGQTTSQMLVRFRQDVIELRPRAVVILAGTNDIAGNTGPITEATIAGHIASMAELAMAHGIRVVLLSVLPADRYSWVPGAQPAQRIVALNRLLQAWAQSRSVAWVDLHTLMATPGMGLRKEFGEDGVHPNAAGYAVMRPAVERALAEALR